MTAQRIFRPEALQRLQSPEELDRLLVVVDRKAWLILLSLGGLCLAGIVWSIVGRIPVTVDGIGVLVNPGNVKGIQSPATGQVIAVEARVGQQLRRGDTLVALDQPELRKELEQLQGKMEDALAFHRTAAALDQRRRDLETASYEKQRQFISEQIDKTTDLAKRLNERGDQFSKQQTLNLARTKQLTESLNASLKDRLAVIQQLRVEGLSSQDLVLSAEGGLAESEVRLANLEVQLQELQLNEIQRERSQLEQQNRLSDLALQLMQLDIAAQRLEQELTHNIARRENEARELRNAIARLELRLERDSRIVCDADGTVLEVTVVPGQIVGLGSRVATLEMSDPKASLTNLSFFNVRDGKRILIGDRARVTPTTVQRERDGSIVGRVTDVSVFPITEESVINEVGNSDVARMLMQYGGAIEVAIELQPDPDSYSGFQWTSRGPEKKFSAGTTTMVRVTIEERAPITYLLPILRTWFFGENDDLGPVRK
jgi:HlyD family secretion protein